MRFSLRTLLIGFVMVGLTLATILSGWKLQQAKEEVERVRKVYGLGGPNRYRLTFIDVLGENVQENGVCHLIRIDEPDNYLINQVSYDEDGSKSILEQMPLTEQDLEFSIWRDWKGEFRFQSLKGSQETWMMSFRPRKDEVVGYYPYSSLESEIKDGPFLVFVFCSPEVREMTNMQQIALDEEKLKAGCAKYKAKSICFEFERVEK